MATGADVRDILELGGVESENTGTINKKDIINSDKVNCSALRGCCVISRHSLTLHVVFGVNIGRKDGIKPVPS